MTDGRTGDILKMLEDARAASRGTLGDLLDFMDQIPDAPRRAKIPFPYGNPEHRPYGWSDGTPSRGRPAAACLRRA
ncbi:MAG: hypothetical protein H3C51_06170 [Rubellimicrobium sp.]|nr:hypothetical protein [Rubellimicrobium sp.]